MIRDGVLWSLGFSQVVRWLAAFLAFFATCLVLLICLVASAKRVDFFEICNLFSWTRAVLIFVLIFLLSNRAPLVVVVRFPNSLGHKRLRNLTCPCGTCLLPLFALVFPCCSCLPLFALVALLCPSLPFLPLFCSCCNSNQLLVSLLLSSNSPLHCDFFKQRPNGLSLRMRSCRIHSLDKTQSVSPSQV